MQQAQLKIEAAAKSLQQGHPTREGLGPLYHLAGLLGQRLWFYNKTKNYSHKLKINSPSCIGCGVCVRLCPMQNLSIVNQKAEQHNKCTMCYRCISHCPQQAITLLGNKLYEQCTLEKYL